METDTHLQLHQPRSRGGRLATPVVLPEVEVFLQLLVLLKLLDNSDIEKVSMPMIS